MQRTATFYSNTFPLPLGPYPPHSLTDTHPDLTALFTSPVTIMPFVPLPNELVYRVAEFLPPRDANHLRRTSTRFAGLFSVGIVNITCEQKDRDWCIKLIRFYAKKGNVAIVRRILQRAAETIQYRKDPTVLEGFVRGEQDEDPFLTLYRAGIRINARYGPFNGQPIHWAVEQGRLEVLRVLLAVQFLRGVSPEDWDQSTPDKKSLKFRE